MTQPPISFGPFALDPDRAVIVRDGAATPVGHKAIALLAALIRAEGDVVPKAQLMDAAWPGLAVEEGNLTVQIAALRKILGTGPQGEDWIVTVPRVGYRLVRAEAGAGTADAAQSSVPLIAVLPFANLSGDPAQDYFSDGIVEDMITALSRFKSFAVISRNSSFVYKHRAADAREVARELGARYLLEGSVRQAGDSVRINAQLVDGADAVQLWAQSYDGNRGDIFDFQDRITESVVGLIEPNIRRAEIEHSRRDRPGSMDAYDLYLRALPDVYRSRPESVARAIGLLERAIALDPGFAPALAFAAHAYLLRVVFQFDGTGEDDLRRGPELARAALDLTREDAFVTAYAGFCLLQVAREHDTGLAQLRRAAGANPNSAEVLNLAGIGALMVGDLGEAADFLHRSLRLDPSGFSSHWQITGLAHISMVEGRYEEALDWATRSQAIDAGYDATYWMLIAANAMLGHMDAARGWMQAFDRVSPGMTLSRIRRGQHPRDRRRIEVLIDGMRLAGMAEG